MIRLRFDSTSLVVLPLLVLAACAGTSSDEPSLEPDVAEPEASSSRRRSPSPRSARATTCWPSAGNLESQWYRPENIVVSNGTAKITAKAETFSGPEHQAPAMSFASSDGVNRARPRTGHPAGSRPFTSGMMSTRDASPKRFFPLFSRFEIRARLPHGQGLLPAFWLRRKDGGASWGEVDIMEYFFNYRPGLSKFSLHFPNIIGVNATQQSKAFETPVAGTGSSTPGTSSSARRARSRTRSKIRSSSSRTSTVSSRATALSATPRTSSSPGCPPSSRSTTCASTISDTERRPPRTSPWAAC